MSALSLSRRPLAAGEVISVIGELDATNAEDLESFVGGSGRPGEPLLLDLDGLTFMDSSGLHTLLRVHAGVRERGGCLHLAAVRDVPARVLRITGVEEVLNVHSGVEEAAAAVCAPSASPSGGP
ncbi:STAS domain-containing protein [Nonomuraea fuscirosea]|uniref:STAS domain-containing protein n=1 Tax=Nonomuraea fuscirosea TaxID=1291556 RepID=UPI00343021A6